MTPESEMRFLKKMSFTNAGDAFRALNKRNAIISSRRFESEAVKIDNELRLFDIAACNKILEEIGC